MLRIKKITEVMGKHVYTTDGDYFGQVEDVNLMDNKIDGWKIRISGGFMNVLGGARGVIIPQQFVRSIGDVFIINKASIPSRDESIDMPSGPSIPASSGTGGSGFSGFETTN